MTKCASTESLYSAESLNEILAEAYAAPLDDQGDRQFLAFQRKALQSSFAGLRFDFMATSITKLNRAMEPVDIKTTLLDLPDAITKNYETVGAHDIVAPLVYANPGKVVRHDDVMPLGQWLDHAFYRLHCRLFGIDRAMMISFPCPGHYTKLVTFEYLASRENMTWSSFDAAKLEFGSFPFVLAWLYRKDLIDDVKLERNFYALADLNAANLTQLRKFVNDPYRAPKHHASDIGMKPRSYTNSLYGLRNGLSERFDWGADVDGERQSLRMLDHDYSFLQILGDPSAPLVGGNA
ncbi:MAG: hypothetical protein AAGJ32_06650 [Pseudomonadota bacterium]